MLFHERLRENKLKQNPKALSQRSEESYMSIICMFLNIIHHHFDFVSFLPHISCNHFSVFWILWTVLHQSSIHVAFQSLDSPLDHITQPSTRFSSHSCTQLDYQRIRRRREGEEHSTAVSELILDWPVDNTKPTQAHHLLDHDIDGTVKLIRRMFLYLIRSFCYK